MTTLIYLYHVTTTLNNAFAVRHVKLLRRQYKQCPSGHRLFDKQTKASVPALSNEANIKLAQTTTYGRPPKALRYWRLQTTHVPCLYCRRRGKNMAVQCPAVLHGSDVHDWTGLTSMD